MAAPEHHKKSLGGNPIFIVARFLLAQIVTIPVGIALTGPVLENAAGTLLTC